MAAKIFINLPEVKNQAATLGSLDKDPAFTIGL